MKKLLHILLMPLFILGVFTPLNATEHPTDGLVFHWMLDETSGSFAGDASGNALDGFLLGFPPGDDHWVPGHINGGLWMEPEVSGDVESSMRIARGDLPEMSSTTWSVWVQIDESPNDHAAVMSATFPGASHGHNLGFHFQETLRHPRILWNHGVSTVTLISPDPVDTNWNHLALTYDAEATNLRLYVNGELKAESTSAGGTPFDLMNMGRRGNNQFAYRGGLDEVLVYDRALSASEVAGLAGLDVGGAPEFLVDPVSRVVWEGEEATFSVEVAGTEPIQYQWYDGVDEIPGATDLSYSIESVTLENSGTYHVVAFNDDGEAISEPANLHVRPIRDDIATSIPGWLAPEGLVAYWNLDDTSEYVAWDSSGGQHHGALVGFPFDGSYQVAGFLNEGVQMNPPDATRAITFQDLPETTSTTWSAWVRLLEEARNAAVVSATFEGAVQGHSLGFGRVSGVDRYPRILWNHGVISTSIQAPDPVDDNWNHMALTYDEASQTLTLYVNGVEAGSAQGVASTAFSSIHLGNREGSGLQPLGGEIDDVALYDRALSASEIQLLYDTSADNGDQPETFETWRTAHFDSEQLADEAISGPGADASGDGVSNLVNYALGRDPWTSSREELPSVQVEGDFLMFSFTRAVGLSDIEYVIEGSTDLTIWEETSAELVGTQGHDNGTETVTYRFAIVDADRQYARLLIREL